MPTVMNGWLCMMPCNEHHLRNLSVQTCNLSLNATVFAPKNSRSSRANNVAAFTH